MVDIATLGLAVDSRPVADATKELDRIREAAGKAERAADSFGSKTDAAARKAVAANDNAARSADRVTTAYGKWERAATMVGRAVGAIAGALATGAFIRYADAWSDMQSRVGAAIRDMDAAPQMMQRLVDIANASYSPLDQTVEVYSRNVSVLRDLGRGATEAADFTEALNHALVITATRGERAASVQNALSKAMAVGKLQADGLETVLANGGAVAEALAAELGTTVNGLRQMATDGKITGDVIANSLITRLGDLRDRAAEMPATVEDAMVRLQTNMTAFIGGLDQATGVSAALSSAIMLVANNIDVIARSAAVAGSALLIAFAPALLSQMAVGLGFIGAAGVAAVQAITVAMATNPLGLIAVGISTALVALYFFRDEIRSVLGDELFGVVKAAANFVINSFRAAFEDVAFVFSNLPQIVGGAVVGAVNVVINAVNMMINYTKGQVNNLIAMLNAIPGVNIEAFDTSAGAIPNVRNEPAKQLANQMPDHNAAIAAIMATDNFASSTDAVATSADAAGGSVNRLNSALDASGGKKSKAQKEAEKLAEAYKKIVQGARQFIAEQELERNAIGLTEQAANALRYEQEMLNKAANDNIKLSASQRAELSGLAQQMSSAEAATKALKDAYEFSRDVAKGFITDLRQGLQNGEGFFRSFANAALNALDKIVDKLLDDVLSAIFTVNSAGSGGGGGGGGLLGSLFGGIFGGGTNYGALSASGKYLFDTGGWTGGGSRSGVAGLVHGQEFVVRAGPAAQHRQLLEAINSGRPVSANSNQPGAANQNGGHTVIELRMSPDVEARIVEQSGNQTVRIIEANNKARQSFYDAGGNPR